VLPLKEMPREAFEAIINPLEEVLDFAMLFANGKWLISPLRFN
jgi:hypothetical protein